MKQIIFIRRRIAALVMSVGYILASGYFLVSNTEYPTTNQACGPVNYIASGSCCCCKTTIAPLSTSPCLMQAPCNSGPPDAAFSTTCDNKQLATTYTIAPAIINKQQTQSKKPSSDQNGAKMSPIIAFQPPQTLEKQGFSLGFYTFYTFRLNPTFYASRHPQSIQNDPQRPPKGSPMDPNGPPRAPKMDPRIPK